MQIQVIESQDSCRFGNQKQNCGWCDSFPVPTIYKTMVIFSRLSTSPIPNPQASGARPDWGAAGLLQSCSWMVYFYCKGPTLWAWYPRFECVPKCQFLFSLVGNIDPQSMPKNLRIAYSACGSMIASSPNGVSNHGGSPKP